GLCQYCETMIRVLYEWKREGLRILVLAERIPKPDKSGGERRFFALLRLLARRHKVDLCFQWDVPVLSEAEFQRYHGLLRDIGVHLIPYEDGHVTAALAKTYYDVGFFEMYYVADEYASEFRRRQPGAKAIIDSVGMMFALEADGAQLGAVTPS